MSNMQVVHQSSTLEENFVFGSPPLLNGFTYHTCRAQEGAANANANVNQEQCNYYETNDMSSFCHHPTKYGNPRSTYSGLPMMKNGASNSSSSSMLDSLNQLYLNGSRPRQVDNNIKILEQAGLKMQHQHNFHNNNNMNGNSPKNVELVFKKRKDLRVLKAVLSTERFRKVTMMFGGGDEAGREIVDSVHNSMRKSNTGTMSCLFCNTESQVYENFPIVDGTLFLSPVKLSKNCIRFVDDKVDNGPPTSSISQRQMCFICVSCLEGKPNKLQCSSCYSPWNGSFFQVGTLYSYNILSAIPCCEARVKCKSCHKSIIDWNNGDASTLFFSHFSSLAACPHCNVEDYHYVKPLDTLRKLNFY